MPFFSLWWDWGGQNQQLRGGKWESNQCWSSKSFLTSRISLLRTTQVGLIFFLIFKNFFVFSRAAPMAYGNSQARGLIGVAFAGLCHSNTGSKPSLQPTPQLTATPDPHPLGEARDRTYNAWSLARFVNHWATTGTPGWINLIKKTNKLQFWLNIYSHFILSFPSRHKQIGYIFLIKEN